MPTVDIISDIHLNFYEDNKPGKALYEKTIGSKIGKNKSDILIIAGDIYLSPEGKVSPFLSKFFNSASASYKQILVVLGNHDYWNGSVFDTKNIWREYLASWDNVTLLSKEFGSYVYEDILFVGDTLWTNFGNNNPLSKFYWSRTMNDSRMIRYSSDGWISSEFESTVEFIFDTINRNENLLPFVITHHSPTFLSVYESEYKNYYGSDLSERILDFNIKHWVHGHTHQKFEGKIGNTNILCYPIGYPHQLDQSDFYESIDVKLFNL